MKVSEKSMTDMTGNCKPTFLSFFYTMGMYLDFSSKDTMMCLRT